jgi:hypothetical protein
VDGFHADALVDGQVVSSPEGMDAVAMLVALGGREPVWVAILTVIRSFLADVAAQAPETDPGEVDDAVFFLTRPLRDRQLRRDTGRWAARRPDWVWIAASYDPDESARVSAALSLSPVNADEARALLRLAGDVTGVANTLSGRKDILANRDMAARLAQHPSVDVRRLLARRIDLADPVADTLATDSDQTVRDALSMRLRDGANPSLAAETLPMSTRGR